MVSGVGGIKNKANSVQLQLPTRTELDNKTYREGIALECNSQVYVLLTCVDLPEYFVFPTMFITISCHNLVVPAQNTSCGRHRHSTATLCCLLCDGTIKLGDVLEGDQKKMEK